MPNSDLARRETALLQAITAENNAARDVRAAQVRYDNAVRARVTAEQSYHAAGGTGRTMGSSQAIILQNQGGSAQGIILQNQGSSRGIILQ